MPGASLLTRNDVAPRLGVSWDADSADGKSVIKAFYGRFYFNLADTLRLANPGGAELQGLPVRGCSATVTTAAT